MEVLIPEKSEGRVPKGAKVCLAEARQAEPLAGFGYAIVACGE